MRIAIIVHVFYGNLWPEMYRHIHNFARHSPDIFITTPDSIKPAIVEMIRRDLPTARIERVPNLGFDVGPFIKIINQINLDRYDYIVKLHTKRNRFGIVNFIPLFGGQWRRKLLAFCNSESAVEKTLTIFSQNNTIGMVGGDSELLVRPCNELVAEPLSESPSDPRMFVAGTMFIVRAGLLKPIQKTVSFDDFALTTRQTLDTLAHRWERRLGHLVSEQGMIICGAKPCSLLFSTTLSFRKHLYYAARRLFRGKPVTTSAR